MVTRDGVGQPLLKRVATHGGIIADRRLICRRKVTIFKKRKGGISSMRWVDAISWAP
jgi:hypothetical protein